MELKFLNRILKTLFWIYRNRIEKYWFFSVNKFEKKKVKILTYLLFFKTKLYEPRIDQRVNKSYKKVKVPQNSWVKSK